MYKNLILGKIPEYLKAINWEYKKMGKMIMLRCVKCNKEPISANVIPNTTTINCLSCKEKYNLIDVVRIVELDKKELSEEEVLQYLKEKLDIKVETKQEADSLDDILSLYEKLGFDLVPVKRNDKRPIEMDWTNKHHKDKVEWKQWIVDTGLNIGCKTGAVSNVLVVDVDTKEVNPELKALLDKNSTLMQITKKGFHYFYKYDPDFPKTRINDLKTDIETDGGQVVIYPSIADDFKRELIIAPIVEMSLELKQFLKDKVTVPRRTNSEIIREDIQEESFNLDLVPKGEGRSNFLIKMGGLYRKHFNLEQTKHIIRKMNRHLCNPSIPEQGLEATVFKSLEHYVIFDEKELAHDILEHVREVNSITKSDLELSINGNWTKGEAKKRFNKALEYLAKEDKILLKSKKIELVKDLEWNTELFNLGVPINFKVPYFHEYAYFNWQDIIIIASQAGRGKTHLAMNMVKRLVDQGIKPYYIYSETGGRFAKNALKLGMAPNQFNHAALHDPRKFRLPKNMKRPVIVYDWFRPHDWAKTDEIFEKLLEKVKRVDGFMILFMQLKENEGYFAPNMVEQSPAWACKYLYEDENKGTYTKFQVTKIREPKVDISIPCKYDWITKQVNLISELEEWKNGK